MMSKKVVERVTFIGTVLTAIFSTATVIGLLYHR
ncbi:hypothetical protein LZ22198_MCBDPFMK_01829 [Levilactobacillus zymae]